MFYRQVCIFICYVFLQKMIVALEDANLTNFMELRQKRSLIYDGGGTIKFSVSGVWPLTLGDRVNWRQMNFFGSVLTQYQMPEKPLNPWDKWLLPHGKSLKSTRDEFDKTGYFKADPSRMFTYAALEEYMSRIGQNGRQCVLRAICENAQIDEHDDIYSIILAIILTPGMDKDELDKDYGDAMKAGKYGADCLSAYPKCPHGDSFLDQVIVVT